MNLASSFKEARKLSGINQDEACAVIGCSQPTFSVKEQNPGEFRLSEVKELLASLNEKGAGLLLSSIDEFLRPEYK